MSSGTKVVKRNGNTEPLDLNKLHVMVEEACKDLAGVSASQVEMQSGIQFYDGITTAEIQEILIRSASDLIDLDHPNYQFVAANADILAGRKQSQTVPLADSLAFQEDIARIKSLFSG